jgi:hypothetical protein
MSPKDLLQEVWLQVHLEQVSGQALDGIVERQDVHPFTVLDVVTCMDVAEIAQSHSKVVSRDYRKKRQRHAQRE